jgi:RNA polymerase sigma-70 factor (ECF subfamily)
VAEGARRLAVIDRAAIEAELRAAATVARWNDVVTRALVAYGDELLGYLVALTRDAGLADEVFGQLLEDLWVGLPAFRWECSLRTWAYTLARNAVSRHRRGQPRRAIAIDADVAELAAELRTRTATFLRTESRDKFAAIRATLDPDDQTLLILRINRGLAWRDIARVIPDPGGGEHDDAAVTRRAAALRKHFERLKDDLRSRLRDAPGP